MIPNSGQVPVTVARHLLPHEYQVIITRFHPVVLLKPVAIALASLIAAAALSALTGKLLVWLLFLVALAWLALKVWLWHEDYFVVTSQRLMLITGFIVRSVNMMPLGKVTDMSFSRSLWGRMTGHGQITVESASPGQPLHTVNYLPYPEQLYLEVCGLIFKDSGDAGY
jgi:membrane protein YdbS with pleckstrin-like domain